MCLVHHREKGEQVRDQGDTVCEAVHGVHDQHLGDLLLNATDEHIGYLSLNES